MSTTALRDRGILLKRVNSVVGACWSLGLVEIA